jgi:sialidase-1
MRRAIVLCVWLLTSSHFPISGQEKAFQQPGKSLAQVETATSDWKGYQKLSFMLEGAPAFVVVPKIAASGKPWIWRTSFPDFHAEVDVELVRNGYHIGFINVVQALGSDASLDKMDRFYDQVRAQWGLAERPALEPCSRGGLHAYRYAARHPQRIACILGDVPVMDLKSWPMQWPDSKAQIQDALQHYGFASEQELIDFRGNPLDLLEPIATAKIPLRHVICLTDKVVPPEQNSLEAQRRLIALGHDLELEIIEDSDQLHGHHFVYPNVFKSVRFVMQHACVRPNDTEYFELRSGLANCLAAFETQATGRVAFLGGSITFNGGWRDEVMRYLQQRFPNTRFDFIAAGIPSVGSNGHAFRLERDVLARGPVDLVFVEAAVNDGSNIPDQPELMLRSMEGVVRHLRAANAMTDIVHMHFVMPSHIDDYNAGRTPLPIEQHEKVAQHYGCTSLNLTQEVTDRIGAGEFTWESGFNNVHPPAFGQLLYSNSLARLLDAAFASSLPPKPHAMPNDLLDARSYWQGRLGEIEAAELVSGFELVPSWRPDKGGIRAGFANVPAVVASEPNAEFKYAFEGTAFGLFLAAGYDSCVLEFSVDGGPWKSKDSHTQWSASLHLPWPMMLVDGLEPGPHHITVRTTDQAPTRTALHVIHVLLN